MRISTSQVNGCKIASAGAVVMAVVPEKLRSGIIELRTNRGLLYASPSFWERLYLLWTFRNFHRLPQQVLNRQQQRLIEKLCRSAIVARPSSVNYSSLIGSVENLKLDAQTEPAASAGMIVSMSAPVPAVPKAVGAKPASGGRNRPFKMPTRLISFPGQRRTSERLWPPALHGERLAQSSQRLLKRIASGVPATWRQSIVGVGLVMICSVMVLGLLVQLREKHLKASVSVSQATVPIRNSPPVTTSMIVVAKAAKIQPPAPVNHSEPATKAALAVSEPAIRPPVRAESALKDGASAATTPVRPDSAERLYVAEPPESGFGYPVAPNANLTGRVILNALVGADGTVTGVEVLSGNRFLARAAVQEVRRWRYAPHKVDGNAVEAETHIVFNFQGEDAVSISFPPAN